MWLGGRALPRPRAGARSARPDAAAIGGLLRIGVPMAVEPHAEASLFSAAASRSAGSARSLPPGHQVALNVARSRSWCRSALAIATTVRVGNAVGRNDAPGVRRAGLGGLGLALAVQAVSGGLMLALPEAIAGIYTGKPDVIAAAVPLLRIAGVFQLSDGIQVAADGRPARLEGHARAAVYHRVGLLGSRHAAGLWLAFMVDLRAAGMWCGLIAGLTVAAGLLTARFLALSRHLNRVAQPA